MGLVDAARFDGLDMLGAKRRVEQVERLLARALAQL